MSFGILETYGVENGAEEKQHFTFTIFVLEQSQILGHIMGTNVFGVHSFFYKKLAIRNPGLRWQKN